MKTTAHNYAYIDGANLHKGMLSLGWLLDYRRFRVWLEEKYGIKRAYIFIGLIPKYKLLYQRLQEAGFTLVFKEVVYDGAGKAKGNCDADLVLQCVSDSYEEKCEKALLVSSDGDYSCLVRFLMEKNRLIAVLSPSSERKCSVLIKRTGARISYIGDQQRLLERSQKEKAPDEDGTS